jgi:hypothetical protein
MMLDHLAVAVADEDAVGLFVERRMGGRRCSHNPFVDFGQQMSVGSWTFGEHKLEVLTRPVFGGQSFLDAFFAKNKDAAFHHATFIVGKRPEDLRRVRERAEKLGFAVTGYNENPYTSGNWGEFFLSPRSTPCNILVQCAFQTDFDLGKRNATLEWWEEHRATAPFELSEDERVRLVGLLLTAEASESAHTLFVELLGGRQSAMADGSLVFSFRDSPLRIVVRVSDEKQPPRILIDAHSHARLAREPLQGSLLPTFRGLFLPFSSSSAL